MREAVGKLKRGEFAIMMNGQSLAPTMTPGLTEIDPTIFCK
jgi:hypothetical protein